MSFETLTTNVRSRLNEDPRGDRGWWITTRVHLTSARLRSVASYLMDIGATTATPLTALDYHALAQLSGVGGEDPGITLRRHHLLAMETPLQMLRRCDGRSWREIELTNRGVALAVAPNPAAILEEALQEIVFCAQPYFTASRAAEFPAMNIRPYAATLRVLENCEGWIDRDEYDLFVSRIRNDAEVEWAIENIQGFRRLVQLQRMSLLNLVRERVPSDKTYQNWRDMGLHTFSLFGVGQSVIRHEQQLVLTSHFASTNSERRGNRQTAVREPRHSYAALKIPTPETTDEVAAPPALPEANTGAEAEILVAKLLVSQGWQVVFYSTKRGYGFDLWAKKEVSAIVIEVKSSIGSLGAINLTRREYEAAQHYAANYIVAVVEKVGADDPNVWFVQNPAALPMEVVTTDAYLITRARWADAARNAQEGV